MKKMFYLVVLAIAAGFTSCDKVYNAYPPAPLETGDYSLYPDGDSLHYAENAKPVFTANTNTNRNVLIEDFTGHYCLGCPAAAEEAHDIKANNPGRVFVSSVHTGNNGTGSLQDLHPVTGHNTIFYNDASHAIGLYFGANWPSSPFTYNPFGTVSRADFGDGFPVQGPAEWNSSTTTLLTANDLKVNLQAELNYYPSTRGLFVHVEADVLDVNLSNDLKLVVQLHQGSLVATQSFPGGVNDANYVHHDIYRGTIDGYTFGQALDADHLDANENYYFDYISALSEDYDASNMHLVIYVRDAVTEEIYQVIEKEIQ